MRRVITAQRRQFLESSQQAAEVVARPTAVAVRLALPADQAVVAAEVLVGLLVLVDRRAQRGKETLADEEEIMALTDQAAEAEALVQWVRRARIQVDQAATGGRAEQMKVVVLLLFTQVVAAVVDIREQKALVDQAAAATEAITHRPHRNLELRILVAVVVVVLGTVAIKRLAMVAPAS